MMLTAPRLNPPPQHFGLGWFVLVSLALHGALLGLWPEVRSIQFGETMAPADTLTLNAVISQPPAATEQAAVSPQTTNDHPSPTTDRPRIQPSPAALTQPIAIAARNDPTERRSKPSQQEPPAPKKTPPQQATSVTGAEVRHRLLGRIRLALADHFHYPMQARRLGWQGTVLLGFRITPDRRIEAIRVKQSSGYRLLDEAAVEALGKVRQLPSSEELQLASAHDLSLPVLYHIKER